MKPSYEDLEKQIKTLADFIMQEVPGEPSQSEGAVECAIRIIRGQQKILAAQAEALRKMVGAWSCPMPWLTPEFMSAQFNIASAALSLTKDSLAGMRLVKAEEWEALIKLKDAAMNEYGDHSASCSVDTPGMRGQCSCGMRELRRAEDDYKAAARQSGGESSNG